ncbi:MAG: ABC transporter permease subunit [Candidatus Brocadiia bacterium]
MRNVATIARRELMATFLSPVAYIVLAAFLVLSGYLFYSGLVRFHRATVEPATHMMGFLLMLMAPMLTMRLFAQEFSSGTIEMLMTAPVTAFEVVLGKYLASLLFLLVLLAPTLAYPAVLFWLGEPDPGPIVAGYLGLVLLGAFLLGVGMVASACTRAQISAAILTFVVVLSLWLVDFLVPPGSSGWAARALRYLSFWGHYFGSPGGSQSFVGGVVDTRDAVYFLSCSAFCVFLTTVIVSARKWR